MAERGILGLVRVVGDAAWVDLAVGTRGGEKQQCTLDVLFVAISDGLFFHCLCKPARVLPCSSNLCVRPGTAAGNASRHVTHQHGRRAGAVVVWCMLSSHTGSARVILGGGCAMEEAVISMDDGMALIQSRALAHSNTFVCGTNNVTIMTVVTSGAFNGVDGCSCRGGGSGLVQHPFRSPIVRHCPSGTLQYHCMHLTMHGIGQLACLSDITSADMHRPDWIQLDGDGLLWCYKQKTAHNYEESHKVNEAAGFCCTPLQSALASGSASLL